jgi:hypothetical protein
VAEHIERRVQGFGLEVDSVGVKDIILPGEMKAVLAKVVEAEKAAAANVIRRREETSATRSLLNTARVMAEASASRFFSRAPSPNFSNLEALVGDHELHRRALEHAVLESAVVLELRHRQLAPHAPHVEHEGIGVEH